MQHMTNEQNEIYEQITTVPELDFTTSISDTVYLTYENECSMNHK